MKAILLLFDSLNRHLLSSYGCDWTHTPNFRRLAERSVRFDRSFIGSMPCIPARRELHTGRYNFLHRSWGPLEPFDDSAIELLSEAGVYTHLITDHQHYWEDGGATYHNRYRSYELIRGQEGDKWKGQARPESAPAKAAYQKKILHHADTVNRKFFGNEGDLPQSEVFALALDFLDRNADADNWLLHVECFDPHEPFLASERHQALYPQLRTEGSDWPDYGPVRESDPERENIRLKYAALLSQCDENLGRLLDHMDRLDLWKDTLLIVFTDHGFLLSEHDYWGKMVMPFYNEVALTPMFIWDPRHGQQGVARQSVVQLIDLPPTLLEYFGQPIPKDMQGRPLDGVIARDEPVREAALFGAFGGPVNCTDGHYVYMRGVRAPDNKPLFQYTLMPTHMRKRFSVAELQTATLAAPFSFTKGLQTLKVEAGIWDAREPYSFSGITTPASMRVDLLFDIAADPSQGNPLTDRSVENRLTTLMTGLMEANDAPVEQFERMGLERGEKEPSG
jgi:arylsulfatase A-like enzyme